MFDVLVIGGGLAGTVVALEAHARGARVAMARRGWGATAMSTGAIDIAYTPALAPGRRQPQSIAQHIADIIAHRPRHPYGVLGLDAAVGGIERGWQCLQQALQGSEAQLPALDLSARNLGAASSLGAVIASAQVLPAHSGFDVGGPLAGPWGVVQLAGDPRFDAARVAAGIRHDAQRIYGAQVALHVVDARYQAAGASPVALARRFDERDQIDALAADLAPKVKGMAGLLLPPVLGLERAAQARAALQDALGGMPVVEALAHLPSVPGVRLQRALDAATQRAGVTLVGEIARIRDQAGRLTAAETTDDLLIDAAAFVLATGRFVAGGAHWRQRCEEALLGLPLVTELGPLEEDSPHNVIRERPVESHPLMTAGVQVDAQGRPMREGRVAYANLFAAGMLIGGFASRYALSADGVALATAWRAAQGALAAANAGGGR